MTQVGGPAAINGFLYQVIHHLGWMASVTLTGKLNGQEVEDACFVLEPRSGGDARAQASGIYIVEQYKTRANGTWSLSDMESVLRGLRRAVPPSHPASACYRFVTNGRAGRLDTFEAFLADVRMASGPDTLDNAKKRNFRKGLFASNREFFDHVNTAIRCGKPESTAQERAVTFHLLSHFKMEFCVNGAAIAVECDKLLRRYAPDLGDERGIREHLVGVLFGKLSEGETRLDAAGIDAIFRDVGLNPERLHSLAELSETMSALTHRRLARLKYKAGQDIRGVPQGQEDKPVLLIAGESGVGKTWQLGRLLEARGKERYTATLVRAAQTHEDLLMQASRDVWQTGLSETSDKTIVALSNFLAELEPQVSTPRLIVALDDVQDIDLARDLVRQDWDDWGKRLVLTVPPTVARALAMTDSDAVQVHTVGDFSIQELDALLRQSGRRWADLPSDLKVLLRKPILAGLFRELPYSSVQSAPRSEYEIFDRFWQRIGAKGRRGDEGIVLALAGHVLGGNPYPLLRPMWLEIGLTDEETVVRLEATGWLRSTDSGELAFAHDRLLDWAVAKALVQQFKCGQISIDDLGDFLAGEDEKQDQREPNRFAYVPLDVLWLLAEDEQNTQTLGRLVARMEDRSEFPNYSKTLYVHLLPTLGQRVVRILLQRLNEIAKSSSSDYRLGLIGKALIALVQQENVTLKEAVDSLLNASSHDLQNVALAVLATAPNADHLDRLWELHQHRLDALEEKTRISRHSYYQASFAALRAGVALNPRWLRDRILAADAEKESVSNLGYLLHALEHPDAPSIWMETGHELMSKVSVKKPRSLLYCIARFADRDKLDFVLRHLSCSEDFAGSAALAALSILDPPAAINKFVEVADADLYLSRDQWLPVLLRAQPELTCQRIRELAEPDIEGSRRIVNLFWERPDQIDEAMLRFLLRSFENHLRTCLDGALWEDQFWLHRPLDFFGRVTRQELLAIFEAEAGGELEKMIVAVACSRLRTNSRILDKTRESARRILILIGGEGISALIKRELESDHFWVRHGGLNWAAVRADDGILERLIDVATRPVPQDADDNTRSNFYREFRQALTALAALGADTALVEILENSGLVEVPSDLAQLRAHRGPMPKDLTHQALQVLENAESSEDLLLTALLIAWLSGDADMIPPVRSVLERADKKGRVAVFACIALEELGDSSDDFLQLAYCLLHTEENSTWGLRALIRIGNRGANLLVSWLSGQPILQRDGLVVQVIHALYRNPATRDVSIRAAVDRCQRGQSLFDDLYGIAAEAGDAALREQILDKAFAAHSFVATQPLHAIEALAKFDVARAVEAIELAFQLHPNIERRLSQLLVRIAPETAAVRLVDAVLSIERKSLHHAVGRALRRFDPEVVSRLVVQRMSGLVSERKAAVELAGWLPTPATSEALSNLADHDRANKVRQAAFAALDRHRREASVRALLAAFPVATPDRRWGLLIAILEAGDPHLLTDHEDQLWIGNILTDEVPAVYEHHANSVLRRRLKEED